LSDIIETGRSHVLGIDADFGRQRSWLEAINPDYFLSTASNLETLAAALDAPPRLPALRAIQSFGETLTEEMRQRAEAVFGVPVWDMYSCQEAGYLASQCPTRSGYHVHAENVILEVVDAEGIPCAPGQVGQVLITTLLNYANPLIRYSIGDEAVAGAPCACGRGLPTLVRVLGKERPLFRLPAGGVKNTSTLASSISKIAGVQQFQFEQRAPDDILLRLVPSPGWGRDSVAEVAGVVGQFFESRVRLNIEMCARIPPTRAGKVQSFVPMSVEPVNSLR
jgi:phenylacetate-CoA ligase